MKNLGLSAGGEPPQALILTSFVVKYGHQLYATRDKSMPKVSVSEAQMILSELIDSANQSQEPIIISGQNQNGVLISEDAWRGIQETIYLLSIPQMGESIKEGLSTPISECSKVLVTRD